MPPMLPVLLVKLFKKLPEDRSGPMWYRKIHDRDRLSATDSCGYTGLRWTELQIQAGNPFQHVFRISITWKGHRPSILQIKTRLGILFTETLHNQPGQWHHRIEILNPFNPGWWINRIPDQINKTGSQHPQTVRYSVNRSRYPLRRIITGRFADPRLSSLRITINPFNKIIWMVMIKSNNRKTG